MTACGAWRGGTRLGGCEKKHALQFVLGVLAGEAHDGEQGQEKRGKEHGKHALDSAQPRDQQRRRRRRKKKHAYTTRTSGLLGLDVALVAS